MTSISASGERNTWGFRVISEDVSQAEGVAEKTCLDCPNLHVTGKLKHFYECALLHSVLQAGLHPVCGKKPE